jgi:hypothetical protein
MLKHASVATTRAISRARVGFDRAQTRLLPGRVIASPETGLQYRIERLLGEAGFGRFISPLGSAARRTSRRSSASK